MVGFHDASAPAVTLLFRSTSDRIADRYESAETMRCSSTSPMLHPPAAGGVLMISRGRPVTELRILAMTA